MKLMSMHLAAWFIGTLAMVNSWFGSIEGTAVLMAYAVVCGLVSIAKALEDRDA